MPRKFPPIWRPYTQHQTMQDLTRIVSGKGPFLTTDDGREILDLVSSWWVNIHGHAHPHIANAISEQCKKLEHVIFAGFSHEPGEEFARQLIALLGAPFEYIFYSDNGSTAVEVAIKMALQFAMNRGEPKRKTIIGFEGGFHGDTWAAMSAGSASGFFSAFKETLVPDVIHLPYPVAMDCLPTNRELSKDEHQSIAELEKLLESRGEETAALIVEPLIQGASGMRFSSRNWLEKIVNIAQSNNVIVIFDEVMTGFSRTGKMFSFENLTLRPDIVCLSKGITGGFLPFAATVATGEIYESFLGDTFAQALCHGHSYTGNPISCAAGLASLELFENEKSLERIAAQTSVHREMIPRLPGTKNHRVMGAIAACEFETNSGYASTKSINMRQRFLEMGMLLRPLGDTFYMMPPTCVTAEMLSDVYQKLIASKIFTK